MLLELPLQLVPRSIRKGKYRNEKKLLQERLKRKKNVSKKSRNEKLKMH